MGGFSTPTAGGITKLSELIIDADKDWQAKEVGNLKGIASGMVQGDVTFRGTSIIQKLAHSYGVGYNFLRAKDTGVKEIEWLDIQQLIIYLTGAVNRMIAPPILTIPAPTLSLVVAEDHSGGGFVSNPTLSVPTPAIALVVAEDHSGGGFTSTPTLAIPVPSLNRYPALLDQKYQTGDDGETSLYGANWEAQTFTPSFNHSLNILWLKIARVLAPGDVTVSLRATAAGLPSGADLQSVTISGNDLSTTARLVMFLITAQALTAATKYAIVIRAPAGDVNNCMEWRKDTTAPTYAGGARCRSANSGVDWVEETGEDYIFEEGNYV